MTLLNKEVFVCIDCETTGLDLEKDRIIEVAAVKFTITKNLETYDTLVNPEIEISTESYQIHKITSEMVAKAPITKEILPSLLIFIDNYPIMGHGINFDVEMIKKACERANISTSISNQPQIDTLRLARHYGEASSNSLENLARHFNVPFDQAHRALSDVLANIEVFKHLIRNYQTIKQIYTTLSRPIKMKVMPLGKHKGRQFEEIPIQYLQWAANMDFDQDLLYTIRFELKRRKKGDRFTEASNPFHNL
ncbi:MAG: DUF3820 family protein [Chlamydiia bacterium]|nr:DUF3820 family protein [Chlamydiia bacterium]